MELLSTPWVRVTLEQGGRVVRLVRTSERLTLAAATELEQTLTRRLPLDRRAALRLLIDARQAPMLSGDESERPIVEILQRIHDGFGRSAVLVMTAVGRLQANRVKRDDPDARRTLVNDEAEAMAFLLR